MPMPEETAETMAQQARQHLQRVRQEMKGRGMEFEEMSNKHHARMGDLERQRRGLEALLECTEAQKTTEARADQEDPGEARW
jgi:hypothetical protein